jgi:hypothetical protein
MSKRHEKLDHLDFARQHSTFSMNSFSENRSQAERAHADRIFQTEVICVYGNSRRSRSSRKDDHRSQTFVSMGADGMFFADVNPVIISPTPELATPSLMRVKSSQDTLTRPLFKRTTFNFTNLSIFGKKLENSPTPPNEFLNETYLTPAFGPGRSTFFPTGSIFQEKVEEHPVAFPVHPPRPSVGFDRLINFLTKFYKCDEMSPEEYEFGSEDMAILKSFVKRKYKKRVHPE